MEVFFPNLKKAVAYYNKTNKSKIHPCQWSIIPSETSNLEPYPMGQGL